MSYPAPPDFTTQVRTLGDVACQLCRAMTDNQARLRDMDAVARTEFLGRWMKNYEVRTTLLLS